MKRSGLGRYVTTFKDQGIDMDCLTFVQNEQDLSELGVDLSVHRRKLLHLLLHQTKAKQEQVKKVDMKREGDESSTCDDTTVIPTTTGTPTQVDMLGAEPICLGDVVSTKESVVSTKDNVVPSKDSVVPSIESVVSSEEESISSIGSVAVIHAQNRRVIGHHDLLVKIDVNVQRVTTGVNTTSVLACHRLNTRLVEVKHDATPLS